MLFGPAYKGITLAASCAIAFYESKQRDIPYAYNRKEAKDHGEGGILVGAPLKGNVVIIDDVITAGTAIHESMALFKNNKEATCTGVIVALDRQECGKEKNTSAITAIESQYDLQVANIICLDDIIHYLKDNTTYQPHLPNIIAYRERYGICNK
jgi:orotate phosphoribosyltransferase